MKALITVLVLFSCSGCWLMDLQPVPPTGVTNGKFEPCRKAPNCVSSQADPDNKRNFTAPIAYEGSRIQAFMRLLKVVRDMPRVDSLSVQADYVHAEVQSRVGDYTDDLEFYLPLDQPFIDVRALARTGWYDFNTNRKRVEEVRQRFAATR